MPTPPSAATSTSSAAAKNTIPNAVARTHAAIQGMPQVNTIAEERRRGRRVLLRIRANAIVMLKGKEETLSVMTLSVNPAGAMLVSPRNLSAQTQFVLEHAATKETIQCRVVSMSKQVPEGFHVPISFDVPAPNFWKIDFPPEDWKPHDDM
ncbi:MAG: hypothetical protein WB787_07285 [Candidatus Acidiferrales bacterium]